MIYNHFIWLKQFEKKTEVGILWRKLIKIRALGVMGHLKVIKFYCQAIKKHDTIYIVFTIISLSFSLTTVQAEN